MIATTCEPMHIFQVVMSTSAYRDTTDSLSREAVSLAAELLQASHGLARPGERRRMERMRRMIEDPGGKSFTIALADEVLRPPTAGRAGQRFRELLREQGMPGFLSPWETVLLRLGSIASRVCPWLVIPMLAQRLRRDSRQVILSGEHDALQRYLRSSRARNAVANLNRLGEAILGEDEARRRLEANLALLAQPGVTYISVKISALVSQIHLTAYDTTLALIKERLRLLFREAMKRGGARPKFVNLDMEEYRDLHLTVDAFCQVLDEPEFARLEAGIVLQAYLPDAFEIQKRLTRWAMARHDLYGSSIKVRLVKGANLAMESVEAELHGWKQAPFTCKRDVDANFKRMVSYGCHPNHARAVRLGIGSHNLFDIAYALLLRERCGVESFVEFEMLEGMANAEARSLQRRAGQLIMYAPIVRRENFKNAVAYLVRRLDENTDPENFLYHLFGLEVGLPAWEDQRDQFLAACQRASSPELESRPRRQPSRHGESHRPEDVRSGFSNEPNTDFSLEANRAWCEESLTSWLNRSPELIPLQIQGRERQTEMVIDGFDPSRPGVCPYSFCQGTVADVERAIGAAAASQPTWAGLPLSERARLMRRVAAVMRRERGATLGAMVLDGGKAICEADAEISEAIDFAHYYSQSAPPLGLRLEPFGVVVVTPPWNFPYAIPASGCLAALMAGNSAILKPAPQTVLTAWLLVKHLWEAGIPRDALQFLPVPEDETGRRLITDPRVGAVVLTGAYETAQRFRDWKPGLRLFAETSGKNSFVITAAADLDLAIRDLVRSAFGHSGQKCSAASIALVEREVYDDRRFRLQLRDAAASLPVSSAWAGDAVLTPLIQTPDADLQRALTTLEEGETWLLEPRVSQGNPRLWSPGIKLGVQPGSWFHQTECFGPVLGLIRVRNLAEAIGIQNASAYGLTGAIHSLDPREIASWLGRVQVGNAYINRACTGAIVRRQPFGGWKRSCVGPGAKAGGPNYVSLFGCWREETTEGIGETDSQPPESFLALLDSEDDRGQLIASARSYAHWWSEEFSRAHDPSGLKCESNAFRYRARDWVLFLPRQGSRDILPMLQVALACECVGTRLIVIPTESLPSLAEPLFSAGIECALSLRDAFYNRSGLGCLRTITLPTDALLRLAHASDTPVFDGEVLSHGRAELRHYLIEQSVSQTMHRYGTIAENPPEACR